MDGQAAHRYAATLHDLIKREPGWNYVAFEKPEWYSLAVSAATLLSGGEVPAYVSGQFSGDENGAGTLHLFYANSVVTIEAHSGASDRDKATVTAKPRGGLQSLDVHVSDATTSDMVLRDRWPGKVHVTASYADGDKIVIPASSTYESEKVEMLRELVLSLRADLNERTDRGSSPSSSERDLG